MPENPNFAGGEDNYGDAAMPASASKSDPESEGATALLPKSIFPGMEPGDELVLKITRVHDDQYEVEYSAAPEEDEEVPAEEPEAAPGAPPAGDEMASMME